MLKLELINETLLKIYQHASEVI